MDPTTLPREERIALLDVLRGVALLGILIMNVPSFGTSFYAEAHGSALWSGTADHVAQVARDAVFSGKFNGIFSMLFGLGFTLQFERLQRRQPGRATLIYIRRLASLLALGLIHGLLFWPGDILTQYALLGFFVMLPLRYAKPRAILLAATACVVGAVVLTLWLHVFNATPERAAIRLSEAQAWRESNELAYGHGTLAAAVVEHVREFAHFWIEPVPLLHNLLEMLQFAFTMLLGAYVGRKGWLRRIPELPPRIRRLAKWSLGIGFGSIATVWAVSHISRDPWVVVLRQVTRDWVSRPALAICYVLAIAMLLNRPRWPQRFAAFAAAGRMPLTNYLMQTALCTTLFYGWGFGLWGKVGPLAGLGLAVAIFAFIQVPLSLWWMARHERGPLEAAWARLTYGRP